MKDDFIIYRTDNEFLSSITDYFFYIDTSAEKLAYNQEDIIPYPRITLGYFFDYPFSVTAPNLNRSVNFIISRIHKEKITVQPQNNRIKIIGVHLKPYALAYFTKQPVSNLPLIIDIQNLFKQELNRLKKRINNCRNTEGFFIEFEYIILENILIQDLTLITSIIDVIEKKGGNIKLIEIAKNLGITTRTIRNHFYKYIGCTPKDYIELVKLKKAVHQLYLSECSLTNISYNSNYFDQSHFIKTIKRIIGKTPKHLQKEISNFRFLQF